MARKCRDLFSGEEKEKISSTLKTESFNLLVLPDNDTSVTRGPATKKAGRPKGRWSGANPPPEGSQPSPGCRGQMGEEPAKPISNHWSEWKVPGQLALKSD